MYLKYVIMLVLNIYIYIYIYLLFIYTGLICSISVHIKNIYAYVNIYRVFQEVSAVLQWHVLYVNLHRCNETYVYTLLNSLWR
jgi:hypothetical protein